MIEPDQHYLPAIAGETLEVCNSGSYKNTLNEIVNISSLIKNAKESSRHIAPRTDLSGVCRVNAFATEFYVANMTTLAVVKRFKKDDVCALNFANAKNRVVTSCWVLRPKKSFFADVQHSIRVWSVVRCTIMLSALGMEVIPTTRYILRTFRFLEMIITSFWKNFIFLFVTCAAPNYNENCFSSVDHIEAMKKRINRVLNIMNSKGHDHIVLGDWGCGAFGHNAQNVAFLFHEALTSVYNY